MPGRELEVVLAANSGNRELFRSVAERLEATEAFNRHNLQCFADRELKYKWGESVAGKMAIILATTRTYEQWEELYQMMSAARDARAEKILVIILYYGSARQDRKDEARVAISLRMHAEMLEANAVVGRTYVGVVDPHNVAATQCSFRIPCDIVYTRSIVIEWLLAHQEEFTFTTPKGTLSPVIYSTDAGGSAMVGSYADRLRWLRGYGFKVRRHPDQPEECKNMGPSNGRTVCFLDDMIDTGGTMCDQAVYAKRRGGARRVVAIGIHAVLAGPAIQRLGESAIDDIVFTNTLPIDPAAIAYLREKGKRVTVLDVTDIIVQVIKAAPGTGSISSLFK